MTRSELEKLSLYLYGKNQLTLSDAQKIIIDSSALQTADLTYAMFGGDTTKSLKLYPKVLDIETPVILIRVFLIYVRKLLSIYDSIESGTTINDALKINGFRFFKIVPVIKKHLQLWSVPKLLKCMQLLIDTDIRCKSKDAPTNIFVSDMIIRITKIAVKN
jgi:DNA polymerase III delta subunit